MHDYLLITQAREMARTRTFFFLREAVGALGPMYQWGASTRVSRVRALDLAAPRGMVCGDTMLST